MKLPERWLLLIGWTGLLVGVGLIVLRARSFGDALLDLQLRIPEDPIALFGNILAVVSGLFVVWLKLRWRRRT